MRHSRRNPVRAGGARGLIASIAAVALGTIGLVATATSATAAPSGNSNHPAYWEARYAEHDAVCFKHEGSGMSNAHGNLTDRGRAVTLNPFQAGWPGDHWEVLIVKGGAKDIGYGAGNAVYEHPSDGTAYYPPANAGGQKPGVSHWIVCKGTTPDVPPTEVRVTPPVVIDPTCDAPGDLSHANGEGYTWAESGPENARVLTATAGEGYVLIGQSEFGPYDLTQLTGEQCDPIDEQPTPIDVTPPVVIDPTCDAPGDLSHANGEGYTWAESGPENARVLTATAGEGYVLIGQSEFGPYDLTQLTGEQCDPIDEQPETPTEPETPIDEQPETPTEPETPIDEQPETPDPEVNEGLLAETGTGLELLAIAASLALIGGGLANGGRLLRTRA